jgi:hypothetical protein
MDVHFAKLLRKIKPDIAFGGGLNSGVSAMT